MGKSFVSFSMPVKYNYGRIPMTRTAAFDAAVAREIERGLDALVDSVQLAAERRALIAKYGGAHHRPDRSDLDKINRAAWRKLELQRRLARMGKPAGQFIRAGGCDGATCPKGLVREFYNRESGDMTCESCPR